MKSKDVAVALLISFLGIYGVKAQQVDLNITGAGARADGFGGAFTGVADDATSVVWNPSGLATLERPEASVVARVVSDSYEIGAVGREFKISQSHFVMNFVSGAYPFELGGRKMVAAVAYQRQIDLYWSFEDDYSKDELSGGIDTFTPGIGIRLTPLFSVGGSANIWGGGIDSKSTVKETQYTDAYTESMEESFSGFNLVIGGLADLSALESPIPLKIGVTLRTPFDLEGEYESEGTTETETIEMPLMLGVGGSYRVGENLTFALDYETRAFGDSKIRYDDSEDPLTDHEEDLNQFRVGAEYLLVSDLGVFPIRVGFKTVPTLWANEDESGQASDQVVGTGFSIGSGLITEKFSIDLTLVISGYEQEAEYYTATTKSNIITASGIFYF